MVRRLSGQFDDTVSDTGGLVRYQGVIKNDVRNRNWIAGFKESYIMIKANSGVVASNINNKQKTCRSDLKHS